MRSLRKAVVYFLGEKYKLVIINKYINKDINLNVGDAFWKPQYIIFLNIYQIYNQLTSHAYSVITISLENFKSDSAGLRQQF